MRELKKLAKKEAKTSIEILSGITKKEKEKQKEKIFSAIELLFAVDAGHITKASAKLIILDLLK